MRDFDQFELRVAAALRSDADMAIPPFDPSAIASAAVAGARRRSVGSRLGQALAPRRFTLRVSPVLVVLGLVLALVAGALAVGVLRSERPRSVTLGPTGPAPSQAVSSASPSAAPSPTAVHARAPSWTVTGSMATPRWGHTATLLPNGKVLVAGGYHDDVALTSAELYDPGTGTWATTGSMTVHAGGNFTATLLANGRVLVAGGGEGGDLYQPTGAAELYDPETGTWTATGSLNTPRSAHMAVQLQDGTVLVAGGIELSAAELYNPATGMWTATGNMGEPRYRAAVALLADGRVLVAGGAKDPTPNPSPLLDSAELYNPASATWTPTGKLSTIYVNAAAITLPSGTVLVAAFPPQLYDPGRGSWTVAQGPIISGWSGPALLLLDGRALVLGAGHPGQDVALDTAAAIYDPVSASWTAAGSLTTQRWAFTATLLPGGSVLVAGGWDNAASGDSLPVAVTTVQIYDPGSGR
jgi:large repetitive protein